MLFTNDADIPAETRIYVSKLGKIFMAAIMVICFTAGVTLITVAHSYIVGIIMCVVSGYLVFDSIKRASNNVPQIIINSEGIETVMSGFHSWKEIKNETVGSELDDVTKDKVIYYYLAYDFIDGNEKIYLYGLYTNHWKMKQLLRVYRGRSMS